MSSTSPNIDYAIKSMIYKMKHGDTNHIERMEYIDMLYFNRLIDLADRNQLISQSRESLPDFDEGLIRMGIAVLIGSWVGKSMRVKK